MQTLNIKTSDHSQMKEVTNELQAVVSKSGVKSGVLHAYVPHTTAGITINENADPTVVTDVLETLENMVPWNQSHFRHAEGNSAAHVKAIMTGSSEFIPIQGGKLVLGTWQGVYFMEYDGPRSRKLHVQVISSN